jgi:FKBP-type peptidyl-prolyl cis-trans isomerase
LSRETAKTPDSTSVVNVEYTGTFIYGDTFDTSRNTDNPATFNVGEVIAGFGEGLQLMQEGSRYELFLPADLAYGENPPPGMYPGATLIFDVELISVSGQ